MIGEKITEDLRSYNSDDHVITVHEVKNARERLKKDKYNGCARLSSNHVLYSADIFNVHLSMLATAMTVHGYNAEDLLIGAMISLPIYVTPTTTGAFAYVLKKVVNYDRNGRSKVYACFMDASKAFNRIRHDKLFNILQDKFIHLL